MRFMHLKNNSTTDARNECEFKNSTHLTQNNVYHWSGLDLGATLTFAIRLTWGGASMTAAATVPLRNCSPRDIYRLALILNNFDEWGANQYSSNGKCNEAAAKDASPLISLKVPHDGLS